MLSVIRSGRAIANLPKKTLESSPLRPIQKKVMTTSTTKGRSDMYDTRKYSPCLPKFDTMTCFEPLPNIPTGVFRCTTGEDRLGPCASKCWYYKNPEYFCFHDMTFFDFHLILRGCRMPSPKTGRKP
ncbi:uncharacterized protein LOC128680655 [Plodia interpunctella]|uniref:uncharacterized protein LOC128680655 n=1 Tax=Plodia interpunctella TaxID=58824 RepID=UPI002368E06D|nr:uncharacterized protein LOC128680655 [Plodia interpunctella]